MERAIILGASRGLGFELCQHALNLAVPVLGFGRKEDRLRAIRERYPLFEYQCADFSREDGAQRVIDALLPMNFNKIFFVAGGGPYGRFADRNWEDHQWAWNVTFLFAARVLHAMAKQKRFEQVILIGSSVAEAEADLGAASYCAAKHALCGLYKSLKSEYLDWDIRLFSPGYMDTDLIPQSARVREYGIFDPKQVARELWTWSLSADYSGHKVYPKHPPDRILPIYS